MDDKPPSELPDHDDMPPSELPDHDDMPEDEPEHKPDSNHAETGNGSASGNGNEPPDDDHDAQFDPGDLGLPEDYDPKHIPSHTALQDAAINALHREVSFVILHQKHEPERITERLHEIAEVILAASQIKGKHQARAIRLGLELKPGYWLVRNDIASWVHLLMPLLKTALEIKDHELQSRLYHAWSLFHHLSQQQPGVEPALAAALDYANDSGIEELQLLARAELFNSQVLDLELAEAHREAELILADVWLSDNDYVQGQVYLSLARVYEKNILRKEMFTYAQQALVFFVKSGTATLAQESGAITLAGESVTTMLGSLLYQKDRSASYIARLLTYLEDLAQRSVNPYFQATIYYSHGVKLYHDREYDKAREYILKTWLQSRIVNYRTSLKRISHMLGLIQTKRHQWRIAERHLKAAWAYYEQKDEKAYAIDTQHALALILKEQRENERALQQLEMVLSQAKALPHTSWRFQLISDIEKDITEVKQHLK